MLVEQALRERRVGVGEADARHLQDLLVRRERLGSEQLAELAARFTRQRHAALAVVVLTDKGDRVGHREVGGGVAVPCRSVRETNVAGSSP